MTTASSDGKCHHKSDVLYSIIISQAMPPLCIERKGLGNIAYTTCTLCSGSPIRLEYFNEEKHTCHVLIMMFRTIESFWTLKDSRYIREYVV